MPSGAPWSVKGIDPRARAIAKTAARKEGLTLGEWLNRVILEDPEPGGDWDDQLERFPGFGSGGGDNEDGALRAVVDRLAERLEAAERRSTLAISGVDQSLNALTRRLDALEDSAEEDEGALESALSRARNQHDELLDRVRKLERSGSGGADPSALKAVESALGKLAGRLYETERDMRAEIDNLAHREEERGSAAQKALKSVKSLADHVAESERRLASEQGDLRERLDGEARARAEALSGTEDRARSLQSRIIAAESATHRAAETLAQSHERLESRLQALENKAGDGLGAEDINRRFELLGRELADLIRETRQDCARQIAELNPSGAGAPQLERALEAAEARLTHAETRQSDALARIGQEVSRLARAVDKRIEEAEHRLARRFSETETRREGREARADFESRLERVREENAQAVRRIGEQMARLGESLADRVHQAEARSANAVEQAGERMAQVVEKLETERAPEGADLDARIRASEERTAQRIEDAMQGVHARLDQARAETADALSPVQRAMSALADRLEAIEQRSGAAPSSAGDPAATAAALDLPGPDVSLDPATPLPQPPGLDDEAGGSDWDQDPGAVRDSFVMDAEAPRPAAPRPAQEPAAAPQAERPPQKRPRAQIGATADADFLAAARKTVRANTGAAQWTPPPEPGEAGGGRRLLIAASLLGFVAVAAAAGMLALEAFGGGDQSPASRAPDSEASLSSLFADPAPQTGEAASAEDTTAPVAATTDAVEPDSARPDAAGAASPDAASPDPAPGERSADSPAQTRPSDPAAAAGTEAGVPAIAVETPTLEAAASAGDGVARYQLALQRLEAGAAADAAALMRRAAEQGVPEAMRRFGLMQARGEGVAADPAAGRAMVVAAAEAGNVQAMHDAGGLFVNAQGVEGAETSAAQWFQQAALHGVRDSQFNMALLFQEGFGVPQSLADAYAWFLIAGDAGDTDAVQRAADLRGQLSADQRSAAEQAARDFTPRRADPAAQGQYPTQPWQAGETRLIARTQTLLAELGYDPGPADGVMGDQTRRAIVRYQRAEGLEPGAPLNAGLVARLERSAAD